MTTSLKARSKTDRSTYVLGQKTNNVLDYKNYAHSATVNTGVELSVPLPAKFNSLRSLFVSFRSKYSGAYTYIPLDSTHHGLSEYTFRLGSKTVPTKAPRSVPNFFFVLGSIGSVSNWNHEPSINLLSYDVEAPNDNDETASIPTVYSSSSSFYIG